MRKLLVIASLWTAGLILLAHSVVPHLHHSAMPSHNVCETEQSESILDFLSKVFHTDLGTEHLEHFQVQKTTVSWAAVIAVKATWTELEWTEDNRPAYPRMEAFQLPPDQPMRDGFGLRGPPQA